jgi:hypothetical protein
VSWHRVIRVASLLGLAAGIALLLHRLNRTPEQLDLTRYVEVEVPGILRVEKPIEERLDRLGQAPGLKPEEARALLVDDVIPRLLKLKKQVEQIDIKTIEVRALNDEYLKVTDRLIDACRACVRVIDDPKLPQAEGLKQVRERFREVHRAYRDWDEHVQAAARRHRLAKPAGH